MTTVHKKRLAKEAKRIALRTALLGFVASFGVVDVAEQRRLAARLWRVLPRDISAEGGIGRLTGLILAWGEAVLGRRLRLAELRMAFMVSGVDPFVLLLPREKMGALVSHLSAALPNPHPAEKPLLMPVQSLKPISVWACFGMSSHATSAHAA